MNDFGLVQLIWIKRLVSETSRINTLIECKRLSRGDLERYKSVISAIDDFCAFVINSQNWGDVKNISNIVEEVEMVLFQHFYEQIDAFENEKVHLDFSKEDQNEINLRFENPLIKDQSFGVIDDESYMDLNVIKELENSLNDVEDLENSLKAINDLEEHLKGLYGFEDLEESFGAPIVEGEILEDPEVIEFEINNENPLLGLFDMKPGESREISVEDFIKILTQNQDELSFTLNPETFPDEADILSEDEEVSLDEFIAHIIEHSSKDVEKGVGFGVGFAEIEDNDDFE